MSVQLDALADEVFEASRAAGRAGSVVRRRPYGEVVTDPDYPDVFYAHGLYDLHAPDWTLADLEAVLRAELPHVPADRVHIRDPLTRDRLGPLLQGAGYRPEHKVAMLEVSDPALGARKVALEPVVTPSRWMAHDALLRAQWSGTPSAVIEQVLRLTRARAEAVSDRPYLATHHAQPIGVVSLHQQRRLAYVHALYVLPDARRRGLGTAIMLAARTVARERGAESLALLCLRGGWLPDFYRRLGYVAVGEEDTWTKAR
ncbi:MAG TPA: GNAT family N-acetyltransferase [Candidatus Limnocylindrales bacterium]|nr:GNAT family N-acetyltransferase [Candidatus Limnocylindrales bacterium]